jgi:hypothetical protein
MPQAVCKIRCCGMLDWRGGLLREARCGNIRLSSRKHAIGKLAIALDILKLPCGPGKFDVGDPGHNPQAASRKPHSQAIISTSGSNARDDATHIGACIDQSQ